MMLGAKYNQIISEGCRLMGEGGAHQADPYPDSQPRATQRFGEVVPHHPRGSTEDARADGPSGRREAHERSREIAQIVRASEETVRRWLKRYLAEGVEGLRDVPHPGAPRKVTEEYRELC
jgi:Winged helix-turn helix